MASLSKKMSARGGMCVRPSRLVLLGMVVMIILICQLMQSMHATFVAGLLRPAPETSSGRGFDPDASMVFLDQRLDTALAVSTIATAARLIAAEGLVALPRAFGAADLVFTFGSRSLAPFVSNLLSSLVRANMTSVLVGALDDDLFAACQSAHVPVLRITGGGIAGYFRKQYDVFKQMGARKARFLVTLLSVVPRGVWVCDADVAFLRGPPASLLGDPSLASADVLLSSDCIDLPADVRRSSARA